MTGFKVILKSKDAMETWVSVSVSKNFRFRRKATKREKKFQIDKFHRAYPSVCYNFVEGR